MSEKAPSGADSIMLGLVGHPNVGKSSMVNHLSRGCGVCGSRPVALRMGEKVVSVKATPGHTKILQTLRLDDRTELCDSPGVVFPRLEVPREAQIVGTWAPVAATAGAEVCWCRWRRCASPSAPCAGSWSAAPSRWRSS